MGIEWLLHNFGLEGRLVFLKIGLILKLLASQ